MANTTFKKDQKIGNDVVDLVAENCSPEEVFGEEKVLEWVREHFSPEDVFTDRTALDDWAFNNGYAE